MTEHPYARRDDAPIEPTTGPSTAPGMPASVPPESASYGTESNGTESYGTESYGTQPAGAPAADRPELTVERTRTGAVWVAVIAAAVVLLLLLIFILQNTEQVEVALFGANPNLPLGVALLLAAVLGALIVALIGTARIVQLRILARRHRGADRVVDRRSRR
jgi:uncharacterized integral membrane protein